MKLIKKKQPPPSPLTLRQFYEKRDRVLIVREVGGLGDILMHRMMFEDMKMIDPALQIIFACPKPYHDAVQDHPFINEVLDSRETNIYDYVVSYNTTSACTRYELRVAPFSGEHRSDIWAGHCGVTLRNHNMHITIPEESKQYGKQAISEARGGHAGPCVLISPVSAMVGKNLTEDQLQGLVSGLRAMDCFVCAIHKQDIPFLKKLNVPVFNHITIPNWMGILNAADYVISVDSAAFHFAGGIKKPLMGIFTFVDGKVYSKYFDAVLIQKHRDDGDWDCGPCYNWANCPRSRQQQKPCLTEITTPMLMNGVKEMFKKWPFNSIKLAWDNK